MKDLTQGRIGRLLVAMAVPIAIGMLFQTLYFLIDLYFVSRLGDAAIAGVSTAGTLPAHHLLEFPRHGPALHLLDAADAGVPSQARGTALDGQWGHGDGRSRH